MRWLAIILIPAQLLAGWTGSAPATPTLAAPVAPAALAAPALPGALAPPPLSVVPPTPGDGHAPPEAEPGILASSLLGLRESLTDARETTLWGWPLAGVPTIVRDFDPPAQRWLPGHRGIDLAGIAGEPVLAVDDGVVTFSGKIAGVGMISVTHGSGLRSTYQPVTDRLSRGDRVGRGGRIGVLDAGGHCPLADCLHLGAVRGRDAYVDPTPLLLEVDLTLLPVEGP